MTTGTSQPPPGSNPGAVYRTYLTADARPAIRAATAGQLRVILNSIAGHLCCHLGCGISDVPAIGPDRRRPWEVCQVGSAMTAGFQLYQHITQAVAGSYLQALGFDPARAAANPAHYATTVEPFLAAARKQPMRCILLQLTDHLHAVLADSDTIAGASTDAQAEIDDDLWEVAAGVTASIQLYRHAVRVMSVHVRFYIWDSLGIGDNSRYYPYTPGFAPAAYFAVHPN